MALSLTRSSLALTLGTALLLAVTVLECLWLFFGTHYLDDQPCRRGNSHHFVQFYAFGLFLVLLLLPLCVWLTAVASSEHICYAATFMLWNWAYQLSYFAGNLTHCHLRPLYEAKLVDDLERPELQLWTAALSTCLLLMTVVAGLELAVSRVEAAQANAMRSFHIGWCRPILRIGALLCLFVGPAYLAGVMLQAVWGQVLLLALAAVLVAMLCVFLFVLFRALLRILRHAREAEKSAPSWVAAGAERVHSAARLEILFLTASAVSTVVNAGAQLAWSLFPVTSLLVLCYCLQALDLLCNMLLALMLSGAGSGAVQGTNHRRRLRQQRLQRRSQAVKRWAARPERPVEVTAGWEAKTEELASRGLSLSALLAFYRQLPELMPHFDPSRHTTADIVYNAIIPFSSEKACAASQILMHGKKTWPRKMVTHSWGTTFKDLVAAVAADAFEEGEYLFFSRLLEDDLACLEAWVEKAGVGDLTYWICAFSVNQHCSICHHRATDSVTGRLCPSCNCQLPKAENDTQPLLPDGRSVPCEMNKFEHMMRLLCSSNPLFSQVVVLDAHFKTFERAWCIAELATANELGMPQGLKIGSKPELEAHQEQLRHLRIQDMKATRMADKDAILASISDPDAFNASLQRLIFHDLFPTWSSMDAQEKMARAGRLIRWQETRVWSQGGCTGLPCQHAAVWIDI